MGKIYVVADTHFGHQKLVEWDNRPENFEQDIISRWNQIVEPIDTVIHLGDFALGRFGYDDYSINESILMWRNQLAGTPLTHAGSREIVEAIIDSKIMRPYLNKLFGVTE